MKTMISLLLLVVVNLIHCQEHEQMIVFTLQGVLEKVEGISYAMKGEVFTPVHGDIPLTLSKDFTWGRSVFGNEELLQGIPDVQKKLEHLENNLQDMQQKLRNLESNYQELHHELEHVKGAAVNSQESLQRCDTIHQKQDEILDKLMELHHELEHVKGAAVNNQDSLQRLSQETGQCLRGDDLEHLTNVLAAAHQEIKSFHEEMSVVISLAQKDECSEGSLPCGDVGIYSCPSGFTWDGSDCVDIDECTEGEGVCHHNAACKNSIGSYSCSCNKPFEGDGKTSCKFQCRSPTKSIRGLGCVKRLEKYLSLEEMDGFCREEGGRLLQQFQQKHLKGIRNSFGMNQGGGRWVGVYDKKWTSDGSLVPEELWEEGYGLDPSNRCGYIWWGGSSHPPKLYREDCSGKRYGYCQFQLP